MHKVSKNQKMKVRKEERENGRKGEWEMRKLLAPLLGGAGGGFPYKLLCHFNEIASSLRSSQ
jgi:hypothetical protein